MQLLFLKYIQHEKVDEFKSAHLPPCRYHTIAWYRRWFSHSDSSREEQPTVTGDSLHLEYIIYRKTSNISRTFIGNKVVDNSDVVGASPVGAAPTISSFST